MKFKMKFKGTIQFLDENYLGNEICYLSFMRKSRKIDANKILALNHIIQFYAVMCVGFTIEFTSSDTMFCNFFIAYYSREAHSPHPDAKCTEHTPHLNQQR